MAHQASSHVHPVPFLSREESDEVNKRPGPSKTAPSKVPCKALGTQSSEILTIMSAISTRLDRIEDRLTAIDKNLELIKQVIPMLHGGVNASGMKTFSQVKKNMFD